MPISFAEFEKKVAAGLEEIATNSEARLKETVSHPYPPASAAGEPPHMRSGELRDGISVTTDGKSIDITSSAPYSEFVEYGTPKMSARPFIRPEEVRVEKEIEEMIANIKIEL